MYQRIPFSSTTATPSTGKQPRSEDYQQEQERQSEQRRREHLVDRLAAVENDLNSPDAFVRAAATSEYEGLRTSQTVREILHQRKIDSQRKLAEDERARAIETHNALISSESALISRTQADLQESSARLSAAVTAANAAMLTAIAAARSHDDLIRTSGYTLRDVGLRLEDGHTGGGLPNQSPTVGIRGVMWHSLNAMQIVQAIVAAAVGASWGAIPEVVSARLRHRLDDLAQRPDGLLADVEWPAVRQPNVARVARAHVRDGEYVTVGEISPEELERRSKLSPFELHETLRQDAINGGKAIR